MLAVSNRDVSLEVTLGEVVLQGAVVERLATGLLEPSHVVHILDALQKLFIVLDGDDDGDGLAFASHDFGFGHCCFHGDNLSGDWFRVNLLLVSSHLDRLSIQQFIRAVNHQLLAVAQT